MAIKNALRLRALEVVNSGAVRRLKLAQVEAGKIDCYQRISWEINKATALGNTRCRLVIEGHGYDLPLAEQDAPLADTLYWFKEPTWLYPTERIALLIDQPQDSTTAEMHAVGYWVKEAEGIV